MDEKITAHSSKEEREKVLKEIRQLENRKKILENKQRNEERRGRTRRLIERGAILEGIFPLAPNLSGAEVKAFLIALSHLPGAVELTASGGCGIDCKPAKIRGHAISPLFTRAHLYTVAGAVRPAGGVAYFVRDGKLRSPNPLCALRSQTPALRLSGSTEPVIPSLKGGVPHRFLSYPGQYHQAQRRPFCRCRSCLPQRNQADK